MVESDRKEPDDNEAEQAILKEQQRAGRFPLEGRRSQIRRGIECALIVISGRCFLNRDILHDS